jgi:MFS family permease
LGPLQTYWFYARFGAGPAALGALFTATNLLSILPYLGAARVAERLGAVVTVTWSRMVGVGLLVVQALSPTLGFADVVYLVRSVAILLSVPIRQSFVMGITEERSRSTVAAVGSLPSQVTSSISPAVGAYLMQSWTLEAPLWLSVVFQSVNSLLYYRFFRSEVPPEERRAAALRAGQGAAAAPGAAPGTERSSQQRSPGD